MSFLPSIWSLLLRWVCTFSLCKTFIQLNVNYRNKMTNAVHFLLERVFGVSNTHLWPWSVGHGYLWSGSALDLHCGFTAAPKWLHWVSFLITTLSPHFSPLSSRYHSSMDSLSQLHRAQPQLECFVIQLSECGSAAWNISWDDQSSVPTFIGTTQPHHYNRSVYNSVVAHGGPMEQMLAQWCSGWGPDPCEIPQN